MKGEGQMSHTVVLDLPEETLLRYQKGAEAARKPLEEFLVDRLKEAAPPYAAGVEVSSEEMLEKFKRLSDEALWEIAGQGLAIEQQEKYDLLLEKNSRGTLTPVERMAMEELGNSARQLTLRKAQAFMILKWRGHKLPIPDALQDEA